MEPIAPSPPPSPDVPVKGNVGGLGPVGGDGGRIEIVGGDGGPGGAGGPIGEGGPTGGPTGGLGLDAPLLVIEDMIPTASVDGVSIA